MFDREQLDSIAEELEELEQDGWTTWKFLVALDRKVDSIMATLQEVVDAVDQDKAAVEAAAARVTADLQALRDQVTALQDQINAGGAVSAADLDAVVASVDAVTGEASQIDAPPAP